MKKISVAVALLWAYTQGAPAAEIFLEGVTILGPKRTAHLSVDGKKDNYHEGDKVGDWMVERIEPRMVHMKTPDGATVTMDLQTRLSEVPPKPTEPLTPPPSGAAVPPPPGEQKPVFQPKRIEDKDVPPGHRRVRTPFGDVLVKDEKPQGQ